MYNIDKEIKKYYKDKHCCNGSKFFTQFVVEEYIKIPDEKPDIEEVVSAIVDTKIVSLNVIDTPEGTSYEGQHVSGKKIAVEIELLQKIMYISNKSVQSVHVVENSFLQSAYVVVPKLINGSKLKDLIKYNYLKPKIVIENVTAEKIDCRNIFKNIILFMEFTLIPSYILCYSENYNCYKNALYLTYKDGTNKKELLCTKKYKISNIQWSPCGQKIAYICREKNSNFLCLTDIKRNNTYQLTDRDIFRYVSDFSWCVDGNTILFTGFLENSKNIFSINLNTLEWKQLTYGCYCCNNKKAKGSFNNEYIAYIRCLNDNSNLYVMKKNGLENKKITNLNQVKDFSWQSTSLNIAVLCNKCDENEDDDEREHCLGCEKNGDEIFLVDLKYNDKVSLNISKLNLSIKKIKFSPNNKYIAFIGQSSSKEDIYVYDLLKNEIINLTENEFIANISDYDWDTDSLKIYYSCNELHYYNVYYVEICNKNKVQISNTKSNNIRISYRPRII